LGEEWRLHLETVLEEGPIDLVCFTGDAADRGKREEFREAGDFLEDVLKRLGLGRERLFVVPGNHDIDRNVHPGAWRAVRELAAKVDDLAFARWMRGEALDGAEEVWREQVLERQGAYRAWVEHGLGRPELLPEQGPHGTLGYRQTLHLRGVPVHVVGLDTAWLCGETNESGLLRLTDDPVGRLLSGPDGFRLVLMHHPFHDLADGAACRRLLAQQRAHLVLRGHLHETELTTWADPDQQLRTLAAGCLYEGNAGDRWPNACQVVTLKLTASGEPVEGEVRLRSFSPRGGHWFDDDGLYRNSQGGRVRLAFAAATPKMTTGNPFEPRKPAVPPNFVGREATLRQLVAELERGHGISLVGDSRIGKTSLLRTLERQLAEGGQTVRWLDGQGAEGQGPEAFVRAVTGKNPGNGAEAAADALAAWASAEPEGLPPILLVDEFDGFPGRFDPRFFERLRNLNSRLLLVLATRREIPDLYREQNITSPFDNLLRLLRLGLLKSDAADRLIALGGDAFAAAHGELLRRWAGQHPYYLQLMGFHLVEAREMGESWKEGFDRFRDEAGLRLRQQWDRLDERDREHLLGIARGESLPLNRRLQRRGILDEEGKPFGEVLTDWLREEVL
jgi:predicted phosphodiesterase